MWGGRGVAGGSVQARGGLVFDCDMPDLYRDRAAAEVPTFPSTISSCPNHWPLDVTGPTPDPQR